MTALPEGAGREICDTAGPVLAPGAVAPRIGALGCGERLVLVGLGRDAVGALLRGEPPARGALLLATGGARGPDAVLDRLLDDLADLARARWPDWPGGAPEPAPGLSRPWLRAAAKRAEAGLPPRFRRTPRAFELAQLLHVLDAGSLTLIAEIDPVDAAQAAATIAALERCAAHGSATVAVLPVAPPHGPPYDRILYGACTIAQEAGPVLDRFIAARTHHASPTERRVADALARDAELAPLFVGNVAVPLGSCETAPRVDLLWPAGRLVVELDGPEHGIGPRYDADRHRDYALSAAGYLVLRITNRQVADDLQRAVEKIRTLVRLRRRDGQGDGMSEPETTP